MTQLTCWLPPTPFCRFAKAHTAYTEKVLADAQAEKWNSGTAVLSREHVADQVLRRFVAPLAEAATTQTGAPPMSTSTANKKWRKSFSTIQTNRHSARTMLQQDWVDLATKERARMNAAAAKQARVDRIDTKVVWLCLLGAFMIFPHGTHH